MFVVVAQFERPVDAIRERLPANMKAIIVRNGVDRPNEGREPGAWAWAMKQIVVGTLDPTRFVFIQDGPDEHCGDWIEQAQLPLPASGFRWLGGMHETDEAGGPHDGGIPVADLHGRLTGKPFPGKLWFGAGGQFVCHSDLVLRHREKWQTIERLAGQGRNAWALERLWEAVLTNGGEG